MKGLIMWPVLLAGICLINVPSCQSENILIYNIIGTHSTRISMWPYIEALADKGHNITYLAAYANPQPNPKIREYLPKKWTEYMGPWETHIRFFNVRKENRILQSWYDLRHLGTSSCEYLYADEEFVEWVRSSQFDVIVVESLMNECAFGLAHYFKAKIILYSTMTAWPGYMDAHGLPDESGSVSDLALGFPPGSQMSFWQRFVNAIHPITWTFMREYVYFPVLEDITKKGLGLEEIPSFKEIEKNTSLILLSTHYSLDYPRSFPPNVIPIGGVGGEYKNLKPVPKEMLDFINKGNDGFIYISFGTVAEFTNFDESVQQEFVQGLYKFPKMRFIWKLSTKLNATLPKNVLLTKWAPQHSLLAHPKIKAFVTHNGMGSTTEGVHFGVPLICIPVLAEQDLNANVIVSKGAGIKLEIVTLKREELEYAISEILHNEKYRASMKKLSEIYRDRQVSPIETAVWWTEFILRHRDTNPFIMSPSVQQPWWVKRQIDVWLTAALILLVTLFTVMYLVYFLLRQILSVMFKDTSAKPELKKQKMKRS